MQVLLKVVDGLTVDDAVNVMQVRCCAVCCPWSFFCSSVAVSSIFSLSLVWGSVGFLRADECFYLPIAKLLSHHNIWHMIEK